MRRVALVAVLAAALAAGVSWAQGRPDRAEATPLPGLPRYTAGYRTWFKLNRKPIPRRASDPHDGTKNVYASKRARDRRYPFGTVIVKEAFRAGARQPYLIAVMRKLRSGPARHNHWVMVEYTRTTTRSRFSELARGQVCTSCHVGARQNDYVFTRR